jgi:hypothetical protein
VRQDTSLQTGTEEAWKNIQVAESEEKTLNSVGPVFPHRKYQFSKSIKR